MSGRFALIVLAFMVVAVHSTVADWDIQNSHANFTARFSDTDTSQLPALNRRILIPMAQSALMKVGFHPTLGLHLLALLGLYAAFGAMEKVTAGSAKFLAAFLIIHTAIFDPRHLWPSADCNYISSDLFAPLFFAGLIYVAVRRQDYWTYPVWLLLFFLGTLNRETTICLLPIAFLYLGWGMASASVLIWVAAKATVYSIFPGVVIGNQGVFQQSLGWLVFMNWKDWIEVGALFILGGIVIPKIPHGRFEWALAASWTLFMGAMLKYALIWELRAFNEISVIPAILAGLGAKLKGAEA